MRITMPPEWFNPHGFKMEIGGTPIYQVIANNLLLIGSKQHQRDSSPTIAQLEIRAATPQGGFKVAWRITFTVGGECVQGDVHFSRDELRQAFGLLQPNSLVGEVALLNKRFNADRMVPGHFIRKGKFLNVPMPGTGIDGDPNISIFITNEMQAAVRELISNF